MKNYVKSWKPVSVSKINIGVDYIMLLCYYYDFFKYIANKAKC